MCRLNNERYKLCMKLIAIFIQGLKKIRMIRIYNQILYDEEESKFFVGEKIYI